MASTALFSLTDRNALHRRCIEVCVFHHASLAYMIKAVWIHTFKMSASEARRLGFVFVLIITMHTRTTQSMRSSVCPTFKSYLLEMQDARSELIP